jgi:tetratricopeptide (TPR) repeat protein
MFAWETQVLAIKDAGDYQHALELMRELRKRRTSEDELSCILLNEAECLRELGHPKEALHIFQKLMKNSIDSYDRCLYLKCGAKCLEALKKYSKARHYLKEIKGIDSNGDFALDVEIMEVNIRFAEGKLSEAIDYGVSLLHDRKEQFSEPEYAENGYMLEKEIVCEMVNDGQYLRASEAIQRFLPKAKDGDRANLYLYLGFAYEHLGKASETVNSFQQVFREGASQDLLARANYHLGAHYLNQGAAAWAKQNFLEVERLGLPEDIQSKDLYRYLAQTCSYLGELAERDRYMHLAGDRT